METNRRYANQSRDVLFCLIAATFISGCHPESDRDQTKDKNGPPILERVCLPFYFELIADLPGCDEETEATDMSGNGDLVVGVSSADEEWTDTDCPGGSHSYEAFGWTRPCYRRNFVRVFNQIVIHKGGTTGLGYFISDPSESTARGISPDGALVAGWSHTKPGRFPEAVIFDRYGNIFGMGMLPGHQISMAVDASERFTGMQKNTESVRMIWSGRRKALGERVVVGYSNSQNEHAHKAPGAKAVFWGQPTGDIATLQMPTNVSSVTSSEAVCIANEGKVIGGNLYYGAFDNALGRMKSTPCAWMWDATEQYDPLALGVPMGDGKVMQVSGDGKVLVGSVSTPDGERGSVWMQIGSLIITWAAPIVLQPLDGTTYAQAMGTDYFGNTIVGVSGVPWSDATQTYTYRATIWSRTGNTVGPPQDLIEILHANKLAKQVDNTWQTRVIRVSEDGKTFVGDLFPPEAPHLGWVASIP